jgi:hypothetical protein
MNKNNEFIVRNALNEAKNCFHNLEAEKGETNN